MRTKEEIEITYLEGRLVVADTYIRSLEESARDNFAHLKRVEREMKELTMFKKQAT